MDKKDQNKQNNELRIELIFECFITGEMKIFHCIIEKTRERVQRENKADELFDAYINGLEKSFEEYLQAWVEVFKEYRGKAKIGHVKERIPENKWLKLQKEVLSDTQVQAHTDELLSDTKEREIVRQQLDRSLERRMKKLDIV
ncbi:MAG: hypothetical protein A2Y48_02060 [Nitrospirae bacterium RIFCSPLOW2_12_42_9]|nr:MAG: hypothetical protein A2Y48_02060 [Nitrospirae bacterium RIFCSPLOW2_12_42_9]